MREKASVPIPSRRQALKNRWTAWGMLRVSLVSALLAVVVSALWLASNRTTQEAFAGGPPARANRAHQKHDDEEDLDRRLRRLLTRAGVTPQGPGRLLDPALLELGRMLFFDPVISGNGDISCATCHDPAFSTGDALSVSIGTKGVGRGFDRDLGDGFLIPRNTPGVFNRGDFSTMFWDSRVEEVGPGVFISPAGDLLPAFPFLNVMGVQAMFPVTSRDEMRGHAEDIPLGNELAAIPDGPEHFPAIWNAIMDRLLAISEYDDLFAAAYPDVAVEDLGWQHGANAVGAFQETAFTFFDTPFDAYVAGDDGALTLREKRGAILFYGKALCSTCHSGNLFTDQQHHNLCVPQVGPGKTPEAPEDHGRFRETGHRRDKFAFRTPPLRNVALNGPWMHDGAYTTLEGAVNHHYRPIESLYNYDQTQLHPLELLLGSFQDDPDLLEEMTRNIDPDMLRLRQRAKHFTARDRTDLMAFLVWALTSPSSFEDVIPDSVPSGLPVLPE